MTSDVQVDTTYSRQPVTPNMFLVCNATEYSVSVNLDTFKEELRQNYFMRTRCIGQIVSAPRVGVIDAVWKQQRLLLIRE